MLWTAAGAAALGILVAMEIIARRYGQPGPITDQLKELLWAPKPGPVYGGLALMTVVLTWRQRFIAAGAAIAIDAVFVLVRWAVGIRATEGHLFGNGALWVMLGCAVIAVTRRTGAERLLLLKGVGLGLLLVAGRKTGDTWLVITSKARPAVLDPYVATADHALGNPSWLVGRMVRATGPIGTHVLHLVYAQLAVAAVVVALYQLRDVAAERRFPSHHLVRTFLWPDTPPPVHPPHPMTYDEITPRNCMPSLHTAWATAIFVHSRRAPRFLRYAGTFWLIATLTATLGFGYHYGADLVAGVVFALTIEAALRALDRGWDRPGIQLVAYGTTVFAALLVAYRWLPMEMAGHPWVFGPLLLLAMTSVIYGYVRTTRPWEPAPAPTRRPEPQPELV
ncbi:DUF5933 domain-containing protein [Streptomyces durhamensis]|uniref:DUF5933 domain-containing protein n=1 Tax=Streptomyces durhamensis TaxID=68194 RepID=UPI0004CCFDE1|nr:DUF5933 domain-containing protein [Streptomyces durhamensis]